MLIVGIGLILLYRELIPGNAITDFRVWFPVLFSVIFAGLGCLVSVTGRSIISLLSIGAGLGFFAGAVSQIILTALLLGSSSLASFMFIPASDSYIPDLFLAQLALLTPFVGALTMIGIKGVSWGLSKLLPSETRSS